MPSPLKGTRRGNLNAVQMTDSQGPAFNPQFQVFISPIEEVCDCPVKAHHIKQAWHHYRIIIGHVWMSADQAQITHWQIHWSMSLCAFPSQG